MPSKSPALSQFFSIPTQPLHSLPQAIRMKIIIPPFPDMPVPTRSPRPIPWILFPLWLCASCFLIPSPTSCLSPFKTLPLCLLKFTLSLICERSLHLAQTPGSFLNDTFFPAILWNGGSSASICLLLAYRVG